jgi:Ricin-type beta-trefoil lectin domain-like
MKNKLITTLAAALLATALTTHASIFYQLQMGGTLPGTATAPDGSFAWVNDPVSVYGTVLKVTCMDNSDTSVNSERAEFVASGSNDKFMDQTVYIGWRSYLDLPSPSSGSWQNIMQGKAAGNYTLNHPFYMRADSGTLRLGTDAAGVLWSHTLPIKQWFSIVLKIRYSTDPSVGYAELWFNGVKQTLANGTQHYNFQTWSGSDNNIHWGIYRSDAINGNSYHYMWRPTIATTYAEAAPPEDVVLDTTGLYHLQNVASGLVLNNQGSLTNGSKITQWSASSTSVNLQWKFIGTDSGYYRINSVKSGLDAVVQGASTSAGAGVIQWSFGSAQNDQWKPSLNSDGSYTFVNRHSGLVLEDPGSSTSTSTQMDQWTSNGGANQKWQLIKQ